MFRRHFQAAGHMIRHKFFEVLQRRCGYRPVLRIDDQVVAYAASDSDFFYAFYDPGFAVNIEQCRMISVKIPADGRIDAGRTHAIAALFFIDAFHLVHICRRAAEIRYMTLEGGSARNSFNFLENGIFRPA